MPFNSPRVLLEPKRYRECICIFYLSILPESYWNLGKGLKNVVNQLTFNSPRVLLEPLNIRSFSHTISSLSILPESYWNALGPFYVIAVAFIFQFSQSLIGTSSSAFNSSILLSLSILPESYWNIYDENGAEVMDIAFNSPRVLLELQQF